MNEWAFLIAGEVALRLAVANWRVPANGKRMASRAFEVLAGLLSATMRELPARGDLAKE